MANKYQPHVLILPEDDANRQLANGFLLRTSVSTRKVQILEVAGGWQEVLERFASDHVWAMQRYPNRHMILLIDFDDRENRLEVAKAAIPAELADRVFILGALTEPEDLKPDLGPFETIGEGLAKDCDEKTDELWGHALLRHNANELARLRHIVHPILFSAV